MFCWFCFLQRNAISVGFVGFGFLITSIIGSAIVIIGAAQFLLAPSNSLCVSRYVLMSIGCTLVMLAPLAKQYRYNLIFINPKLTRIVMPHTLLYMYMAGLV